jgi:hypothetical protein
LRAGDDLDDAFAWKEERTLSRALTLQYDKILFILEPVEQATAAIGKRVTVVDFDRRVMLRFHGSALGRGRGLPALCISSQKGAGDKKATAPRVVLDAATSGENPLSCGAS